jgi:hypothetical protein
MKRGDMAQRATWSLSPLTQPEVDRALTRIGLASHDPFRWEALQWFVEFAQRDLSAATEGDWLSLVEEVQALLHLITHQQLRAPLSRDDLRALQEYVLKVLMGLVLTNETPIVKFEVKFQVSAFIRRGEGRAADPSQVKRLGPLTGFPAGPFAGFIGPDGPHGLIYHLACLLMRFPDAVQRCPHCLRLFARFRRHAKYCSRKCQSVVAAREDRRKKAKNTKPRITKKNKEGVP